MVFGYKRIIRLRVSTNHLKWSSTGFDTRRLPFFIFYEVISYEL